MLSGKHGGGVFHHKEQSLRQQLIDARTTIVAQLDKMRHPVSQYAVKGPPDFSREIAELEGQLRDIDELLRTDEEDNA